MLSNDSKAKLANDILLKYGNVEYCDRETIAADLLADLMHWCDYNNASFTDLLEKARYHYDIERTENEQS